MDTFCVDDFDLADDCLHGFAAQDYQARMICSNPSLEATTTPGNVFIAPGWLHDLESMGASSLVGSQASPSLLDAKDSFDNRYLYEDNAIAHMNNNNLADDINSVSRIDYQNQAHHSNALSSWYHDIDAPWIPKVLSNASLQTPSMTSGVAADPYLSAPANHLNINTFGKLGSLSSDSGYETRRSLCDASVFSYEMVDQHDRIFMEHLETLEDTGESRQIQLQRDATITKQSEMTGMTCSTCQMECRTPSELRKHFFRHSKPFVCNVKGCTRKEGFSTANDLSRHARSFHSQHAIYSERDNFITCPIEGCSSSEKRWPRLDNFRSHLRRVHKDLIKTKADIQATIALGAAKSKSLPSKDYLQTASHKPSTRTLRPGRQSSSLTNERMINAQEHVVQPLVSKHFVGRQKEIGVDKCHTARGQSNENKIINIVPAPPELPKNPVSSEGNNHRLMNFITQETRHASDALPNLSASYIFPNDTQALRRNGDPASNRLPIVDYGLLQGLTNMEEDTFAPIMSQDSTIANSNGGDVDEFLDLGVPSPDIIGTLQMLDSTITLCEQRNKASNYEESHVKQPQQTAMENHENSLACDLQLCRAKDDSEIPDCFHYDLDDGSSHITNQNVQCDSCLEVETALAIPVTATNSTKRRAVDEADLGRAQKAPRRSRFS